MRGPRSKNFEVEERRIFGRAYPEDVRKVLTPLWWWSFEEDGVEFEGRDGVALLDGERVCAGAEDDVNELQREVQ